MRTAMLGTGMAAMVLAGVALVVGAQAPPAPGNFNDQGPGSVGPMAGMFEFGGLVGGFGGKLVTGKPFLATFTIKREVTLPGNMISSTTTGTVARDSEGSIYRDAKFTTIGPWASSGKAHEVAFIRNMTNGMTYFVNVAKGTYQAFPIRDHNRPKGGRNPSNNADSNSETVTDNPNGTYTDPVTKTVYSNVDDRKVARTIPAGAIGNQYAIVINSERWYSPALDLLLEETHSDPRFGTSTYQLSNIGSSPASSLFTPDPSFTQVQGARFGKNWKRGEGEQPPPPPPQN